MRTIINRLLEKKDYAFLFQQEKDIAICAILGKDQSIHKMTKTPCGSEH